MKSMGEKIMSAERLLDGIGHIDDALLAEAMSARRRRPAPRILLVAACIVLSTVLVFGAVIGLQSEKSGDTAPPGVNDNIGGDGGDNQGNGGSSTGKPDEAPDAPLSLDRLLESHKGGQFTVLSSREEIPYRAGKTFLVWQYAGESELYLSDGLTAVQAASLTRHLGRGENVGEDSPELSCRVWIVYGNGEVKSPYLKNTAGNTSTEIFDYDPEIYPTTDFISNVSAIINQ